jgi:hypothetical protein
MDLEAKKAIVRKMRNALGVTDVFCTRILKTQQGSVLVGLTASLPDGTSVEEAEVATLILGERVDQLAFKRALANSLVTAKERTFAASVVKDNYHLLIDEVMQGMTPENQKATKVPSVKVAALVGGELDESSEPSPSREDLASVLELK